MELKALFNHSNLQDRMQVACLVAAETIRSESVETPNHVNRLLWAKAAFTNPKSAADGMLKAILAANKDLDVAAITGASDTALQTKVDTAVDVFADGS